MSGPVPAGPGGPPTAEGIADAATVVLLRGEAPFEVFLLRRGAARVFMANMMVFPGGRVDPEDCAPIRGERAETSAALARLDGCPEPLARGLLVGAIRETFEEAGILLANNAVGAPILTSCPAHVLEFSRGMINAGDAHFRELCAQWSWIPACESLIYFSRWVTPPIERRRFDTRFFVTRAPEGQIARHDGSEASAGAWMTPAAAMEAYRDGAIQLAPPTLRILAELSALGSATAVIGWAAESSPSAWHPQPRAVGARLHLLLPGDRDYDPPGAALNRISLVDGRWVSEGSGC